MTPPNGPQFVLMLKCLLERESNWKKWQKSSCPPFEKFPKEIIVDKSKEDLIKSKIIILFHIITL